MARRVVPRSADVQNLDCIKPLWFPEDAVFELDTSLIAVLPAFDAALATLREALKSSLISKLLSTLQEHATLFPPLPPLPHSPSDTDAILDRPYSMFHCKHCGMPVTFKLLLAHTCRLATRIFERVRAAPSFALAVYSPDVRDALLV